MEIVDVFLEKSKDKFLNSLVKIPKQYDWYLGLVINIDSFDEATLTPLDEIIEQKCNMIYDKSEQHIKLLKIMSLDTYTLLLFGTDPIPYNSNIKGIIKSIAKYLGCKSYEATYFKYFRNMIFNSWGVQQYFYLVNDNKAIDLKMIKED